MKIDREVIAYDIQMMTHWSLSAPEILQDVKKKVTVTKMMNPLQVKRPAPHWKLSSREPQALCRI